MLGLAMALTVGEARAETPARPGSPAPAAGGTPIPGDGRTPDQLRGEVLERMRTLRAWKIVDELKLDQATAARLLPILSKYDDRELALMKEHQGLVRDLRAETEAATPSNAKLTASLDRLLAWRGKMQATMDEKIRELRKVLNPMQQAKLVLLLPRIERGFIHRIREASEEQRRPGDKRRDDDLDF
ncbi:MAG TPA: hypothetical protein VMU50_12235 [Polyangia bacterium]|nr:hypothetical protein [Polyangia bacterium]